jgi:hypothetical protein
MEMSNILCHIMGCNNLIKNKLINRHSNILFIDLDDTSYKISNTPIMKKLLNKYNTYTDKKQINETEIKLGKFWQIMLNKYVKYIKEANKNKNKKIIFIGSTILHKNNIYSIELGIKHNFYIKYDIKKSAQETIDYNLRQYNGEIINGTFPLKLIDLTYLINKKNEQIDYYVEKKCYQLKTLVYINKWIKNNGVNLEKVKIYFVSEIKYTKTINLKTISGYSEEWLAMVSFIPDVGKKIDRGFVNNVPFITEKQKNALASLNTKGYLYQLDPSKFTNGKNYKYTTSGPVRIIKQVYMANIYNRLIKNKKIVFKYL